MCGFMAWNQQVPCHGGFRPDGGNSAASGAAKNGRWAGRAGLKSQGSAVRRVQRGLE
jgi:hypothetical protein